MSLDENWDDKSIPEYTDNQKYAFITKRAYDQNFVGFCYRENSDIKIDSGWRFLFGDEDEDYLDNPDNTLTQDISELLAWMPKLETIVVARIGSEFEWNDATQIFDKI